MAAKSLDEKIAKAKIKKEQYENHLKQLLSTQKELERKARTHRLIERGLLVESMIDGAADLTNEQIKSILTVALGTDAALEAIAGCRDAHRRTVAAGRHQGNRPCSLTLPLVSPYQGRTYIPPDGGIARPAGG